MRHLVVRASVGQAEVMIGVELDGGGYAPDVIDDVASRVTRVLQDLTGAEPVDDGAAAILAEIGERNGWC